MHKRIATRRDIPSVTKVLDAVEDFPAQWDPKLGIHVT